MLATMVILTYDAVLHPQNNSKGISASIRCFITEAYARKYCCAAVYILIIFMLLLLLRERGKIDTPLPAAVPAMKSHRLLIDRKHYHRLLRLPSPSAAQVNAMQRCSTTISPQISIPDSIKASIKFYSLEGIQNSTKNITDPKLTYFYPLLTQDLKMKLLTMYLILADALSQVGVHHFVADGALLGIYRMSGILPWDDDLDVVISVKYWREVMRALNCICGYELDITSPQRWAFFPSDGNVTINNRNKKYPFIDIFFYQEDDTYIIILHWIMEIRIPFSKEIIFPLRSAMMEGIKVPVPFDMYSYLMTAFNDLTVCSSQNYLHNRKVINYSIVTVSCSSLFPLYGQFRVSEK